MYITYSHSRKNHVVQGYKISSGGTDNILEGGGHFA